MSIYEKIMKRKTQSSLNAFINNWSQSAFMRTEAQVNKTNRSDNFNKHHIVSVKAVSCHQQSQVFLEVKHILLLSSSSLLLLCIVWVRFSLSYVFCFYLSLSSSFQTRPQYCLVRVIQQHQKDVRIWILSHFDKQTTVVAHMCTVAEHICISIMLGKTYSLYKQLECSVFWTSPILHDFSIYTYCRKSIQFVRIKLSYLQ